VVEEAGCQARENIFLGERVCWEVVFSYRESSTSYGALRILVWLVAKEQGKGGEASDGLCDNEGVYSWGGTCMWGMRVHE
jgi:hypothetical protein